MENKELKPGDCVELKHGGNGVKMTINHLTVYQGVDSAACSWYNTTTNQFETKAFNLEALKRCDNTDK